jgi:uncharacterized membrane protein
MPDEEKKKKSFTEEIEVAAGEIMKKIKELAKEGNIRRVIVRKDNGEKLLEVPLTAGVVVTGGLVIFAPMIAAIVAVVGLFTHVKLEIIRSDGDAKKGDDGTDGGSGKKEDGE